MSKSSRQSSADRPKRYWLRRLFSVLVTFVLLAVLALGALLTLVPALHDGAALTVLTGSMEPTLNPGDISVVYGEDSFNDLKIGDIVVYMPNPEDPTLVTHRLVGWTTDPEGTRMAITQGDANSATDAPWYEKQLRAVHQYKVPKLGYVLQWDGFKKPVLIIVVAALLMLYAVWGLLSTAGRRDDDPGHNAKARRAWGQKEVPPADPDAAADTADEADATTADADDAVNAAAEAASDEPVVDNVTDDAEAASDKSEVDDVTDTDTDNTADEADTTTRLAAETPTTNDATSPASPIGGVEPTAETPPDNTETHSVGPAVQASGSDAKAMANGTGPTVQASVSEAKPDTSQSTPTNGSATDGTNDHITWSNTEVTVVHPGAGQPDITVELSYANLVSARP
ncbi:MAG: signal peptidase I [Propionibacteriaceae bacterium]|jgi:signal peptidase|nr:signal peptidase I [Propionibacteriaceae bacterium]